MTNLVTANDIEKTETFKKLEKFKQNLIVKKENRAILENALIHYRQTGVLLPQIGANNLKILKEIIDEAKPQELDFKFYQHTENKIANQEHFENNKREFSKQCKIVYEALLRGERLTTTEALLKYQIGDLRRRIKDLKYIWNIPVQDEYVKGKFKEYYLNN